MPNSVIELLFRNLRTEINKVVRENEGLRSINHNQGLDILKLKNDLGIKKMTSVVLKNVKED
jgi:predicted transcriptional regulator